jgi:hypothetical protein
MKRTEALAQRLRNRFGDQAVVQEHHGEVTMTVDKENYLAIAQTLRDDPDFAFEHRVSPLPSICFRSLITYGCG